MKTRATGRTRATKTPTPIPFVPPELPPPSAAEEEASRLMCVKLRDLADKLHRINLDNAVLLAQQAAAGRGPLVDHFAELGRRYVELLRTPQKPGLKVINGARG
jgi:hypothetical protein